MKTTQPLLAQESSVGTVPPHLLFLLGIEWEGDVLCLRVIYGTVSLVFQFSDSLLNKILYSVQFYSLQQCTTEVALLYWHDVPDA